MLLKLSVDNALTRAKYHVKKEEITEAKKLYQQILQAFPKNLRAKQGLANLNTKRQNNTTKILPQEVIDLLVNLYNQRQFSVVVEQAQEIINQYPDTYIIWNIMGASAAGLGMLDKAIEAYEKAILLKPDYAELHNNLGVSYKDQGKIDKAIEAYNKAISLKSDYAEPYNNLGLCYKDQGKPDKAIELWKKAISLKPDYAAPYNNLGIYYKDQDRLDKAIEAWNKAISLKPDYAEAYYNLGNAFFDQGKLDQAIKTYNKVIIVRPDYAEAHQNLSFALLNSGKIQEGLEEYEWRKKNPKFLLQERHFSKPLWDRTKSLKGKRILIWSEQGIGDTINWSSCLLHLTSLAEHCILECQEKLVPLLERSFPNVEVKAEDRKLDIKRNDFDFHLPMGSLYKHFINEIRHNANPGAYLIPDPFRVQFWKQRLNSLGKGPFVGISWKSSVMSTTRRQNYAPISDWYPLLTLPNVTFINLQYKDFECDLTKIKNELEVTVHNFDDLNHYESLHDVAALTAALDIVVSTRVTPSTISAGVGTSTKIANWRQSSWNNLLFNPASSSVEMFDRDTGEPWDNVFRLIAEDVFKFYS
jgi:tetratricopeptide (TPR) repeat protein